MKDHFDDIIPAGASGHPRRIKIEKVPQEEEEVVEEQPEGGRSIRNIPVSSTRSRMMSPERSPREAARQRSRTPMLPRRMWIWIIAVVAIAILIVIWLVALRPTTVSIVPHAQAIVFDRTAHFTAYPASAASSSLSYTVETTDLDDSTVIQTQGTVHAEDKASGTIVAINDYSSAPVKLVKNTRFEAPGGLIFRVPADVVIPGKSGSKPGQVAVTVFADQSGDQYNLGPTSKFTLPGLKSNAAMYAKVYGQSTAAMAGGFSGDRPAAAPGAEDSAQSTLRQNLQEKARAWVQSHMGDGMVFPDLARVTYTAAPPTAASSNTERVAATAHVELIVLPADLFAHMIAQNVSADASQSSVYIKPGDGFTAQLVSTPTALGTTPLDFTLTGNAQLVWNVDTAALTQALAGRDKGAFQTIVTGFTGVDEAHARVEPFWSSKFPSDPKAIKVQILPPKQLANA